MRFGRYVGVILFLLSVEDLLGQATFTLTSDELCLAEQLSISNDSELSLIYEWDFCANDIEQTPIHEVGSTLTGISSNSFGFDIVFDGLEWYGFAIDRNNSSVYRLNFGGSIDENPESITNLGNPSGLLNIPEGIDLIKSNGTWYAFIAYENNGGSIIRWDFGNGLDMPPTNVASIGSVGLTGRIRDLRIVEELNNYYLVFPYYNGNQLVVVDLGNDIETIPTAGDATITSIAGSNLPRGFELIKNNGNWIAFFANEVNDDFQQIFIGDRITNAPTL